MKYKYKTLLFVLSLMMLSLLTFNTSFVCAETNKTIISFIDEDGNPLDIEDTVSITKLDDQGGIKVPVSVYIKDGKETTDYKSGTPLDELEIKDGKLEVEGLTKDNEYLLSFDNDFVFQKEEDNETKYYMFGSFKGEDETYILSNQLKSVGELSQEQLEEIAGTKAIMDTAIGNLTIKINCNRGGTFTVSSTHQNYPVNCWSGTAGSTAGGCHSEYTCASGKEDFIVTYRGAQLSGQWCPDHSEVYTCASFNVRPAICEENNYYTCENGTSATQYYNSNGGSCDKSQDTRKRANGVKQCNSEGTAYGSCSYGSWSGSVSAPSCSKGDGSESATITYNGNKGSGSTNITQSKTSDNISRAIHYKFDGFDNYQENFTSDTTATAKYSESGRDNWPSVTLPSASRVGYTFKGWQADGNTYSEGQTVWPNGGKTYTASWEANSYEYTIEFKSSTGKLLDTRKETHLFDESVTISHDPIPGYVVNDQKVEWTKAENGHVVTITYQIITYNIEYSLEIGNRYPGNNATVNPNASWHLEDTFVNNFCYKITELVICKF